jgi:Ca-activated chloride channel family protein
MKPPPPPPPSGHPAPGGDEDQAARVARLTALALGELTPAEAGALEATIWRDSEARLEVAKTRTLAEHLTFAYAAEAPATLSATQRRSILERANLLTGTLEKDARLTAYALGELRPSQAEVLSARLAEDRAATMELEAVGALAARLRAGFAAEPVVRLSLEQRHAILAHGLTHANRTPETAASTPDPVGESGPVAGRPRRWLRTAALAAGFASLGYLASLDEHHQDPGTTATAPSPLSGSQPEFFPPRPPASSPAPPELLALLDREKRRPSAGTAMSGPRERPADAPAAPTVAASAEVTAAPRRQPDASVLPPARRTLAQGTPAPAGSDTLRQSSAAVGWFQPLAGFLATAESPAATLPADLGRAGYDVVRQCIRDFGTNPPASLVRPEEIINQFDYDARPAPGQDFAVAIEAAACPWNELHQLVRVTVAARTVDPTSPPLRLTLFLRLSETPDSERAQLLAWQGMQALAGRLRPEDSVSLVVWGRARGLVLPPTNVADLEPLREAPSRWHLGGPVLGADDWSTAEQAMLRQATDNSRNLCLVLTDGPLDFSGLSLAEAAQRLRTMGAEMAVAELGPLRPESRAAMLADHAATPFFRADSGPESSRLLALEALAPRAPVAENVRLEIAFNPAVLEAWRPVGFGSAGRPGTAAADGHLTWTAGRQLTAMYEVVPSGVSGRWPQSPVFASPASGNSPVSAAPPAPAPPLSVHLQYRTPGTTARHHLTTDWTASAAAWRTASPDFRLAAGAAAFALRLQDDPALRGLPLGRIRDWVHSAATADDDFGLRREFAGMLEAVDRLERRQ